MESNITNKSNSDGPLRTLGVEETFDFIYQGQDEPYSVWLVKDKITKKRLGCIGQKAEGYFFLYTPEVSWVGINDFTRRRGFKLSSPHYMTKEEAAMDLFADKL